MAQAPATIDQQKQQIQVIWSAMLGAVAVYALACALTPDRSNAPQEADVEWPRHVFSAVGVVLGGVSVWWRRHFLSSGPSPAGSAPMAFTQLQSHSVVAWALCDAVGVCGLLLAFLVHDAREFIPFGAAAAALLLLHRPSNLPWSRLASLGSMQR